MSEQPDLFSQAANYSPPGHVQSNVDQQSLEALVAQLVEQKLAAERAAQGLPAAPRVETDAERAQRYLDEASVAGGIAMAGKGVNEHLDAIYHVLRQLVAKAGGL